MKILLFFMIIFCAFFSCELTNTNSLEKEVHLIGMRLIEMDTIITDFKSNRNKPVEGIQNIGQSLYHILNKNNLDNIEVVVKKISKDNFKKNHYGEKEDFHLIMKKDSSNLKIRIKYDHNGEIFKILGYTGKFFTAGATSMEEE